MQINFVYFRTEKHNVKLHYL